MSMAGEMRVTLRLPTRTLFEGQAVQLAAMAPDGAFGMLPNHIDFVTDLVPFVLILRLANGSEAIFGIDAGLLVKKGHAVDIAVLRGVQGDDLTSLQDVVEESFVRMDEEERQARAALSRLEADMVRGLAKLQRSPL